MRFFGHPGLWETAPHDPATAALAASAAGALVSGVGAVASGQAQAASASYQAQVARNNALIAGQNAEAATRRGQAQATDQGLRARAQEAAVRAGIAANNVDVNSGSAATVQTGQSELGALDTQRTVENAALTAYGYRTQQTGFQAQAGLDSATASNDATAGVIGGVGDLLGGAFKVGDKYQQYFGNSGGVSQFSSGAAAGDDSQLYP